MRQPNENYNTTTFEGALSVIVRGKHLQRRLVSILCESAVRMMKKGGLSGSLGDTLRDFVSAEIDSNAQTVWTGYSPASEDDPDDHDYPIWIKKYEGVYFIESCENEPVGYFRRMKDARQYVLTNWDCVMTPSQLERRRRRSIAKRNSAHAKR